MITIRYPNGQAIRYNAASWVEWDGNGGAYIKTEQNGRLVARVLPGSGAIVEFSQPCEVSNPVADKEAALKLLMKSVRQVNDGYALAELKRALRLFNGKTHAWKDAQR